MDELGKEGAVCGVAVHIVHEHAKIGGAALRYR